ncbi:MAG: TetR/AcrR family transcriptional regulator, partial [Mycetocola sp.]
MGKRGSYVKGVAKRQEILTTALTVIAEHGYSRASVKQLAQAVDLSQAGLLHYFGSKEQLFEEVLRVRDEQSIASGDHPDDVMAIMRETTRHNAEVPGLVRLYSALSTAAAVDDDHRSRDFFARRYADLVPRLAAAISQGQESGEYRTDADPDAY